MSRRADTVASERVSGRSFFNLRYALPGYTFILLNILINLRALLFFLLEIVPGFPQSEIALSVIGVFFGFLTLMSGSAIGFLVSQLWHVFYHILHYLGLLLGITNNFGSYRVLSKEFNVKDHTWHERMTLEAEFDNFVHSLKNPGIYTYLNRRWDLLVLFGSTFMAIVLGRCCGYYVKDTILNSSAIPESQTTYLNWPELNHLIWVVSAILLLCLFLGYIFIWFQHDNMSKFVIRKHYEKQKAESSVAEEGTKSEEGAPARLDMRENIEQTAKLILENSRDALIFWAVLVFTCTVGMIELLPVIEEPFSLEQICLGLIYGALLLGLVFSVYRALEIYREIRKLALSGRLGEKISKKAEKDRTLIDRFIDWAWRTPVEILTLAIVMIVFGLLYLTKMGVISNII